MEKRPPIRDLLYRENLLRVLYEETSFNRSSMEGIPSRGLQWEGDLLLKREGFEVSSVKRSHLRVHLWREFFREIF